MLELADEQGVALPSHTEAGLRETVFKARYRDLSEYLVGFAFTTAVLRDREALERVSYELGQDCLADGVTYLEVRFAPQLLVTDRLTVPDIFAAVTAGLDRTRREHEASAEVAAGHPPFRFGIIATAMRMFTAAYSPFYADLFRVHGLAPPGEVHAAAALALARDAVDARDRLGLPIVGFDLAGAEAGHPASGYVAAYAFAHRHFLKRTVHAGEAYGAESIYQAITRLHADRIGHGTHLFDVSQVDVPNPERYVQSLSQYVADRRILLEVCITSNLQTLPGIRSVAEHPVGRMIRERLSVAFCTDNRLMSDTTVTQELGLAVDAFGLRPDEVRNAVLHGFKRSFFPGTYLEKRAYVRKVIDATAAVERSYGVSSPSPPSPGDRSAPGTT